MTAATVSTDPPPIQGTSPSASHSTATRTVTRFLLTTTMLGLALFAFAAWQHRIRVVAEATDVAVRTAQLLEEHARKVFDSHNLMTAHFSRRVEELGWADVAASAALAQELEDAAETTPQADSIWLIDATGRLRASSLLFPAPEISFAERGYFQTLQAQDLAFYVSRTYPGKVTGQPSFNVARRITDESGNFAGLVIVAIYVDYFRQFYRSLGQDKQESVALVRDDGFVLVREPSGSGGDFDQHLDDAFLADIAASPTGTVTIASNIDGLERLYSYRKLEGLPLYVVYGVGIEAILQEWYRGVALYAAFAGPAMACILLFGLFALRRTREKELAAIALAETNASLEQRVEARTAELRQSERRERGRAAELEAVLEAVPAVVWIAHDPDCTVITGNRESYELLRMPPRSNSSKSAPAASQTSHFKVFKDGVELPASELPVQRAARGEEVRDFEEEVVFEDGTSRHVYGHAMPLRDDERNVRGAVGAFLDITDRKRAEMALRESENRFRALADSAPILIWMSDETKAGIYFNKGWLSFTGRSLEEELGEGWLSGIHPEDLGALEACTEAFRTRQPFQTQFRLRRADGAYRWLVDSGIPRVTADGEFAGYIGSCVDITEIVEARRQAEQANRAKTRFFAAASHDLRQPFQAMRLLHHLLESRLADEESRTVASQLGDAMAAGEDLLNALLDVSTLEAGTVQPKPTAFSIQPLCERLLTEFRPQAESKGLELRHKSCRLTVCSDPVLLDRILRNLVNNAIRHTERGRILIGGRRRGTDLRIEVWDTGPGIPADELPSIFEEFYQVGNPARDRAQGLGLGLAIAQRTARLLGHRLEVRSQVGKGSVFAVEVPLAAAASPNADTTEEAPPHPAAAGARILVVEDDAIQRLALEQLLADWGYDVLAAASSEDALARIDAATRPLDLVLTDFRLPNRRTGFEVIEQVRERLRAQIPAIVLTGETAPEHLREAARNRYRLLHKPLDPERLGAVIAETLEQPA